MVSDLFVYTEEEMMEKAVLNKPFYPKNPSLVIVKKGHISLRKNVHEFVLAEHTLFFINPSDVYEFISLSDNIILRIVSFNRRFISRITFDFNRYDAYQLVIVDKCTPFKVSEFEISQLWKLIEVLRNLLTRNEESRFRESIIKNIFLSICHYFIDIMNKNSNLDQHKISRKETIVIDFLRLLPEHFKAERNVGFYADNLSITVRHLSSTLKEITGATANELIQKSVITEAKVLLNSTDKTINEIANELQFNDQYYFSNFFKKHIGISPSEFRSQLVEK